MSSTHSDLETNKPGLKTPYEFKILVMTTGNFAPQMLTELEKLPGSSVHVCSTFLGLVLYLERESCHFVWIIEEKSLSVGSKAAMDYLAKSHQGIPVLVTKRDAAERYLGQSLKYPN